MTEVSPTLGSSQSATAPEYRRPRTATRVLVVFGNIPLLGHERGNIQVFNALKVRGVDALFVTHKEYGHEVIQPELDRLGHRWDVATYPRLFSRRMSLKTWATRLCSLVRGLVDFWRVGRAYKPTHVHVGHGMHFITLLPAIRLLGVPVVYRLGDAPQQHRPLFRFLWRHVIVPNVTQFVCVSEYIRGLLLEAGTAAEKARVIYSYPSQRPADVAPAPVTPFEGRTVLYMGQITADKGVDLLVEAAIALCRARDDVRFLLAGDYSWQNLFAEGLIQRVEDLGLVDRIRFLGYVEDVPGLLATADLHVCPSVWEEPLSNTLVEAKRAAVPSVVFASGGLPELIDNGQDGWVCEEKTAVSLRSVIGRALSLRKAELEAMGEAARVSMERLGITEKAFTEAWLDVYDRATQ
jgi:glycosyltransferase involved in cell wall biosynthesis